MIGVEVDEAAEGCEEVGWASNGEGESEIHRQRGEVDVGQVLGV